LVSKIVPAGNYLYQWKGENRLGGKVASGIYIVRLDDGSNTFTRRIVFLK
jgi:hypothetical protein